jgi:hypothetical protein
LDDEYDVLIENLCVVNAFYEIMSKSFQSTSKKVVNRLSLIKLRPMLPDEGNLKSDDKRKFVPLVDSTTNATICVVCIKFWQNSNSSLSGTLNSQQKHSGEELDHASKTKRDSTIKQSVSLNNIPFYAPIYFTTFNSSQYFVKTLLDSFKNSIFN